MSVPVAVSNQLSVPLAIKSDTSTSIPLAKTLIPDVPATDVIDKLWLWSPAGVFTVPNKPAPAVIFTDVISPGNTPGTPI